MQPAIEAEFKGKVLTVRAAIQEELPKIAKLHEDPKVAPFQYPSVANYAESLKMVVEAQEKYEDAPALMHFYAILLDGEFIGSVTVSCPTGIPIPKQHEASIELIGIGWNLAPEVWGNGYMSKSLELLLGELFSLNDLILFRAECFDFNDRCVRLLERLGFVGKRIPWLSHWWLRIQRSCKHKHLRFELTKRDFEKHFGTKTEIQQSLSKPVNDS